MLLAELKERTNIVKTTGLSNIILFGFLTSAVVILTTDLFFDVIDNETTIKAIGVILLSALGELLYRNIRQSYFVGKEKQIIKSGIYNVLPDLEGDIFNKTLSTNGKIIIHNTWIFNIERIAKYLRDSIRNRGANVEFLLLSPSCEYSTTRTFELDHPVKIGVNNNQWELKQFLMSLTVEERKKVQIFETNDALKFTIYGTTEAAFVGFLFPKVMAVQGPQFLIKGERAFFSNLIWKYYENLSKNEITENIIKLEANKTLNSDSQNLAD
jgi:hypothetical protein